jgi:GT2 family glycosyltransferase
MPKVFFIIVTYNGSPWIEKCLHHLFESSLAGEVVIIDNASTDRTLHLLEPFLKSVHLIRNPENTGFGQANNLGIDYAMKNGAEFIFLLNQDAYVSADTVRLLVEGLRKYPGFGILSPLQLEVSGKAIEPIFKKFLLRNYSEEEAAHMLDGKNEIPSGQPHAMRFVNAAAWMISRECIARTGLFHPVFFHYGEDNHYASRVQYHGMKIGVLPAARVIHDCKPEAADSYSLLLRKIRDVPLYTLLDLRKPLPLAYFLGFLKWKRLSKKLLKAGGEAARVAVREQKRWFTAELGRAIRIRKETKNPKIPWEFKTEKK